VLDLNVLNHWYRYVVFKLDCWTNFYNKYTYKYRVVQYNRLKVIISIIIIVIVIFYQHYRWVFTDSFLPCPNSKPISLRNAKYESSVGLL